MATGSKGRLNANKIPSYPSNFDDDRVGVGDDGKSDSLFLTVIAILLIIVLLLLPLMAWMYVDIRIMEIRVNKALQRIDGK